MNLKAYLIWLVFFAQGWHASAQHYSAVHGSAYHAGLNLYNNPASVVGSPYKWDLTLFGMQYQAITNALRGKNFPLYLSPSTEFTAANGNFVRRADLTYNLRLMNGRYSINEEQAFGFGVNLKGYLQAVTSKINYDESVLGPQSFLLLNEQNRILEADLAGSSWVELYGTYGRTLIDRGSDRLVGGATIKVMKGLAGVFADAGNVGIERHIDNDLIYYKITGGNARYGYSDNLGEGESVSASEILSEAKTGFALDLGIEYIVHSEAVGSVFDDEDELQPYDWKLGLSLLDLGWNNFTYSNESRDVSALRPNTTSLVLQEKFSSVNNIEEFNDSLATIVENAALLSGNFNIMNPARVVLNVDRYVSGHFFVNAELSLNVFPSSGGTPVVKETSLLSITPRWETRKFGLFLPAQVTRYGNFWIGAALKAGPLLLGTHNLLNSISGNSNIGGGAYIAITLRPMNFRRKEPRTRQYDCPEY